MASLTPQANRSVHAGKHTLCLHPNGCYTAFGKGWAALAFQAVSSFAEIVLYDPPNSLLPLQNLFPLIIKQSSWQGKVSVMMWLLPLTQEGQITGIEVQQKLYFKRGTEKLVVGGSKTSSSTPWSKSWRKMQDSC